MQLDWFMLHFLYKYCKGTVFLFVVCIFIYAGNNFFKYNHLQKKKKKNLQQLYSYNVTITVSNIITDVFVFTSF